MKERLGLTEMRKQANRMNFGEVSKSNALSFPMLSIKALDSHGLEYLWLSG
jgi:hypothetical protein